MGDNAKIDFEWSNAGVKYVIRNVPCLNDENKEESFSLDVTLKMAALKDLMFDGKISKDVDFEEFSGIKY